MSSRILDGIRSVGSIMSELAEVREQPVADVAARVVPRVRALYEAGFLVLA
jgi:hypothetical protein